MAPSSQFTHQDLREEQKRKRWIWFCLICAGELNNNNKKNPVAEHFQETKTTSKGVFGFLQSKYIRTCRGRKKTTREWQMGGGGKNVCVQQMPSWFFDCGCKRHLMNDWWLDVGRRRGTHRETTIFMKFLSPVQSLHVAIHFEWVWVCVCVCRGKE